MASFRLGIERVGRFHFRTPTEKMESTPSAEGKWQAEDAGVFLNQKKCLPGFPRHDMNASEGGNGGLPALC